MKKEIIWVVVAIVLLLGFSFLAKNQEVKTPTTLKIGRITLNIEVADTNMEREKGLSGREKLEENEGMLFVFEKEGHYGFWMKDMNFTIDIAWLDKDKKIIFIENNVSPETYPKVFYAQKGDLPILSLYVLEIPAGFLAKNNIQIDDLVAF